MTEEDFSLFFDAAIDVQSSYSEIKT